MLSLHYWVMFPLFVITLKGVNCQQLTAVKDEESSLEGSTVTLIYTYSQASTGSDRFYWYRQHPGKPPEFLIYHYGTQNETKAGLSVTVSDDKNHIIMKISSAAVSDSAVYYCAVRPANQAAGKLYFSKGTKLTVQTEDEFEPYYYKLQDDETTVCLATGFSRHNATSNHTDYSEEFKKTEAGRISSPDPALYNQVIFPTDNGEQCEASGTESGPCEDTLTPDPMVNGVSFTILVLRVIFLKTVVFDILMTMRLWISQ